MPQRHMDQYNRATLTQEFFRGLFSYLRVRKRKNMKFVYKRMKGIVK